MVVISQKKQLVERLIKHNRFDRVKIEKMVHFSTSKAIERLEEDELDELIFRPEKTLTFSDGMNQDNLVLEHIFSIHLS